jgi:hypothetical protein
MTPDEFFSLPPGIALRVLFDSLDQETSASLLARAKPEEPRRGKYDTQLHIKAGYQWASETSLESLRWFRNRSLDSAAREGNEWAARDSKMAENLAKWIAWREWYPDAVWSGVRGEEQVNAAPPSAKPRVHARAGNGQRKAAPPADDDLDPENY